MRKSTIAALPTAVRITGWHHPFEIALACEQGSRVSSVHVRRGTASTWACTGDWSLAAALTKAALDE